MYVVRYLIFTNFETTVMNMTTQPKVIYKITAIHKKLQKTFFTEIGNNDFKSNVNKTSQKAKISLNIEYFIMLKSNSKKRIKLLSKKSEI